MSSESVVPSKHLILSCPLLHLPSIFPSISVFSNKSVEEGHHYPKSSWVHIRSKYPFSKAPPGASLVVQCLRFHTSTAQVGTGLTNGELRGFPSDSAVKNPPVRQELQETRVRSLGQEDPLEEGMATHSSILAWEIPWTEEPGGLQSIGSQRVRHN